MYLCRGAELEYKRLMNKNSEQVNEIRVLKSENENLREDNRKVKHELFAAQDRYYFVDRKQCIEFENKAVVHFFTIFLVFGEIRIRHMSLELDVAREKEHTRKAEYRFQNRRLQNKKSSLNRNSAPNHQEEEPIDVDNSLSESRSACWDSDSDIPINANTDVTSYGSTSATRSIIARGVAESNHIAKELHSGTATPVHSTFVVNKPALRTTGFSSGNNALGTGSKGGLHIASPARPPLSSNRGRHSNGNADRVRRSYSEDNENVEDAMTSSITSLPPPPSAARLPMRAHSMSPLRRNDDTSATDGVSLLAPPSPAGSDVSGRFSRLQKMYERVTARELDRKVSR